MLFSRQIVVSYWLVSANQSSILISDWFHSAHVQVHGEVSISCKNQLKLI